MFNIPEEDPYVLAHTKDGNNYVGHLYKTERDSVSLTEPKRVWFSGPEIDDVHYITRGELKEGTKGLFYSLGRQIILFNVDSLIYLDDNTKPFIDTFTERNSP